MTENNQGALGWLKNAIKSVSPTNTANAVTFGGGAGPHRTSGNSNTSTASSGTDPGVFDSCSDVNVMVDGLAQDFGAVLSAASAAASAAASPTSMSPMSAAEPPGFAGPSTAAASRPSESSASSVAATSFTASSLDVDGERLQNLTARLDRIKTLLYEERSALGSNAGISGGGAGEGDTRGSISAALTGLISPAISQSTSESAGQSTATVATNVMYALCSHDIRANSIASNDSHDSDPNSSPVGSELLPNLVQHLPLLPFEARKSLSAIFNYLLVCGLDYHNYANSNYYDDEYDGNGDGYGQAGNSAPSGASPAHNPFHAISCAFGNYVLDRADIFMELLVSGHDIGGRLQTMRQRQLQKMKQNPNVENQDSESIRNDTRMIGTICADITLLSGSMLRSSLRHPHVYQWTLADGNAKKYVYPFLDVFVHNPNFDVSSDALETVRVMFTGSTGSTAASSPNPDGSTATPQQQLSNDELTEAIASEFLHRQYVPIIDQRINQKCLSPKANYMTRRMSLQLLSTILLNRANYGVMMRYISSMDNLVTIMCLLRDPSPHITLDAFQVFKIFVANPNKPAKVCKILVDNKVKLIKYLEGLHGERERVDEQYRDEKALVIATLEGLEMVTEGDDEEGS